VVHDDRLRTAWTTSTLTTQRPLTPRRTIRVCVVGGGIAGCSTALHLAQRGYKVALLEARCIAWGASGRSGGQAIAGYASGQQKIVDAVGLQDARKLWDISVEGLNLLRELIATHRIDCDLQTGQLHVAIKERQRHDLLHEKTELEQRFGYTGLKLMERSEVESLLQTHRYCAGLYDSGGAHLHPLNYTLGLAAAAVNAGVQVFEHSTVVSIRPGEPATATTPEGRVRARFVALCCNAYIDNLAPRLRSRIMPVGTYIVATEPLGESRMQALMRKNIAVTDVNFVLDYFRRSADHRLLFGGRVSYSGLDPFNTRSATRRRMINVFPQLSDVKIDYAWGGYVDITINRAPDFGRLHPNVYYVQGFSGHGIALTGVAGKLIAEAIAGQAERFDLFARIPHRNFPGGRLLRTPALMLAMMWYRMRDLL
jgi:gamma-glutamylputrescine oxidase